ncbi:MAG: hypothetical protein MH252_19720 [Thermosynechococcaceae cyanobacterium MS004]|nr:hypothetical protein [Thermosynechococcaceae cyanobacterium MS004]
MASTAKNQSITSLFWILTALLLVGNATSLMKVAPRTALGCLMIGAACMYPFYLWCANKVKGIPVFPFFGITYLWTFCLPLLSKNPNVLKYSSEQHLQASLATVLFLVSGTLVWYPLVQGTSKREKPFFALNAESADSFFTAMVGVAALLNMYIMGGWKGIPDNLFTLVRGIVLGLSFLGVFVVAYRTGQGALPPSKARLFFIFLCANILSAAATLILKTALTLFLLSVVAYLIGGRKLPIVPLLLGLVVILPLHYGKHEMRERYMNGGPTNYVQPWEYPAWFLQWGGYALENLGDKPQPRWEKPKEEKESFVERSSVIHMLMMAQEKIPEPFPHLNGTTYAIIPQLLVPRFLSANKIRSHEGTHMLNIHVKRQTFQDTLKTTIAWGLLPEAYANFGFPGCALIGGLFGAFYGLVTRMSIDKPAFSFATLYCILVMSMALASTEWTAGVYAASLFQSSMPIVGIRIVFMKRQKPKPTPKTETKPTQYA